MEYAMAGTAERLISPISTAELERRWAAVRAAMATQGIDVLVTQNSNEFSGGYVKWFTDMPSGNGRYVDATELVDEIMVIKSDEEIEKIRATAALQDRAMQAAFAAIKPGMRDIEVTAVAENLTRIAGAEYGLLMGASSPVGEPV